MLRKLFRLYRYLFKIITILTIILIKKETCSENSGNVTLT